MARFAELSESDSKDDVKTRFQDRSDNSYSSSQSTSPSTTQVNNTKLSVTSGRLKHTNLYLFSFVETPRKFIIAELSIRKFGSSSVLIIRLFEFTRPFL